MSKDPIFQAQEPLMTNSLLLPKDFAALLAPFSVEEFFSNYHDKRPLYIPGAIDKFAALMSWPMLSELLSQTALWSGRSLNLVLDKRKIDPNDYCERAKNRDGAEMLVPDLARVGVWLRRGASLVANDIASFTPALRHLTQLIEQALTVKLQTNLYCSWQAHQGFDSHFDLHDVYALHIAGEKRWLIYGCHFEYPINHPAYTTLGQAFHDQHKGKVSLDVTLKPGDLLYIPRGWYHDALATSSASLHLACGASAPLGLDLLGLLFEMAGKNVAFRKPLPRPLYGQAPPQTPQDTQSPQAALKTHIETLATHLTQIVTSQDFLTASQTLLENFHYSRPEITLPNAALEKHYRLAFHDLNLTFTGKSWQLENRQGSIQFPESALLPLQWMLKEQSFSASAFANNFPQLPEAAREKLLQELLRARLLQLA
jgi:bifunctional lysine-specific demethylase and histidyl-hydroxylase MINA